MSTSSALSPVAEALTEIGFRKRAGFIFTREADDRLDWVGLNTATRQGPPGRVLVHPVLGLRSQPVERLVAQLRGETFHQYSPPTVSEPLYSLLPARDPNRWVINPEEDGRSVAREIGSAVADAGAIWFTRMRHSATLVDLLASSARHHEQSRYRWPVALLLEGQMVDAERAVAELRHGLSPRTDIAAAQLIEFLDRLDAVLAAGRDETS